MIWLLLALFTIVPAVELFVLLQIGSVLGPTQTFLIILITGVVGAWLAKREGLGVLSRLQGELQHGLPPTDRLVEAALVAVGGLLLVTPGVFTDLTGFLLIFPWTRRFITPRLMRWVARRFNVTVGHIGDVVDLGGPAGGPQGGRIRIGPDADVPRSAPPGGASRRSPSHPFADKYDDLP